jgi:hypothetical protein
MAVNRQFGVDAQGNSRPGVAFYPLDGDTLVARQNEQDRLASLAAAAEVRLNASVAAGSAYNPDDFSAFAEARGISPADRIKIKLTVNRTGKTIQEVMRSLHIG